MCYKRHNQDKGAILLIADKTNGKSLDIISRLYKNHVKKYNGRIITAILFMAIAAACTAAIAKLVQPAIDELFLTKNKDLLIIIPAIMVGIACIKGVAEYFQNYLIRTLGQRILTDLQILLYEHLLKLDLEIISQQSSGKLISRFTNDITLMRGAVSNILINIAKHLLTVLFLILIMFKLEPFLSFLVFFIFPLALYPIILLGKKMRSVAGKTQEKLGSYTSVLDETFRSIRIIKSYLGEQKEALRAEQMASNILQLYKKAAKLDSLTSPIIEILGGFAIGGIIWYGGSQVIAGNSTAGSLFAFIAAFFSAYRPFKSLVSLNINLQEGLTAADRLFKILDLQPKIIDSPNAQDIKITKEKASIEFSNIKLNFNDKIALKNLNFYVNPGETLALVGESGGGKTSITNLLVRFFEPNHGTIKIAGFNIKDITLNSLRKNIALVTQEVLLFNASILNNIAYSSNNEEKDIDIEKVISAARAASAHEFISKLPEKYNTIIETHGSNLSGGQRQRLSLARALFKDAPILILDEATSSLDPIAEREIQEALQTLRKDRTTIIVAHRLSTITSADRIMVIKNGEAVEEGTHQELLNLGKEYYNLYHKQIKVETDLT